MRTTCLALFVVASSGSCSSGGTSTCTDTRVSASTPSPKPIWRPSPGTSWQWQLKGTIDDSLAVKMYDVDLFDTPDAVIADLKARGVKVICYFSAGSYEAWRPDIGKFAPTAIGQPLDGWPGERWLDIRDGSVRARMLARLDRAAERGCDGVEPDNVDGYTNESGFPLTACDQLDFNRFLAREAHARGLSVGLKNDLDQAAELQADFDWALVEECAKYDECDRAKVFVDAGKAVFQVEYGDAALADKVCAQANARNYDTLIKQLSLETFRISCR